MHGSIIDWHDISAGITLNGLLDDSYLGAPMEGAPRPPTAASDGDRQERARAALCHLLS